MRRLNTIATIAATALVSLGIAPVASAQYTGLITDSPTINSSGTGYCTPAATACGGNAGSISPATLVDGTSIAAFVDLRGTGKMETDYFRTQLAIIGYAADPGQNSLAWANCGGVIYRGAQASVYNYSGGRAAWFWNVRDGAQPAFKGRGQVPINCSIYRVGDSGWIRPKYQVAGLTYAPPGSRSSVTYANGFSHGTSVSQSLSFASGVTHTVTLTHGGGISGVLDGSRVETSAYGWERTKENSSSASITQQTSNGLIVPGPASSAAGVDHDYDTIYVWLNPEIFMMVFSTSVVAGDYGFDLRDPVIGMDVVPLTVGQLRGTQPIPPNLWARLNRTWDPQLGGLTSADFQDILLANPFAVNPAYNPNTDTSRRYEMPMSGNPPLPANLILNYTSVPPGGQPTGQTYSSNYSSTTELGKLARDQHRTTHTVDITASINFLVKWTTKLSQQTTTTYTNQWSQKVTSGLSQSANFTIFPPLSTDNYSGPTAIQVWKDNVYGTFMFYPLF